MPSCQWLSAGNIILRNLGQWKSASLCLNGQGGCMGNLLLNWRFGTRHLQKSAETGDVS